jgi:signal transduction histidine kinase
MFVPHMVLDAYAFDRAEMFDRNPTTSRAAERTAIDDLRDPILALALDRRLVRLNPAAEAVLDVDAETARDRPLADFLDLPVGVGDGAADADGGESVDDEAGGGSRETVRIDAPDGAGRRTYAVSVSRLTDPNGTHVGYTVVLSDVTERERRRQQLEVLNRILRHNLRNDAGVVHGYGEILRDRLDDPELVRMADAVERRAGALAALGEKAGTVERLLADSDPMPTDVRELSESVVADARERDDAAAVELVVDGETGAGTDGGDADDWTTHVRPDALEAVVENTVENAIDHHDGEGTEREDGGSWVRASLRREGGAEAENGGDDARFVLTVEDDGPGIPDHEVEAVESGRETALEHGSGLGLWVVAWGAAAVGADVTYADREPRGTRVTVSIPVVAAE